MQSLKRNLVPLMILVFTIGLLVFSNSNLPAVKNGLQLFANSVVPSLFPFFIATEMLMHTNLVNQIGKLLNPIMKPLFNVNRCWCFCVYYGVNFWLPCWSKNRNKS